MNILGVDPGKTGSFCLFKENSFGFLKMPLTDSGEVAFFTVFAYLKCLPPDTHVFLERAMPMAMGSKHAFNYGRGFAALEIAIQLAKLPVTYVEPAKWTKVMLEGIDSRLKPKERCAIAVERLFPNVEIEKNSKGRMHEGQVDALLILEYGRRILK